MKFSGKLWLMIILKVAKNQGFTLSLQDTIFDKPQEGGGVRSNWPPAILGLNWKTNSSAGFLREPSQNFRVPLYEKIPVGYFPCVSIIRKTNNKATFYETLKSSLM